MRPLALVVLSAALSACAPTGRSVQGQVFEVANPSAPRAEWRRVPSEGAFVIVTWRGTIPQPAHAGSVCLHSAIGRTDAQGRFDVPGWWAMPKLYPVIRDEPAVTVYKPGFDTVPDYRAPKLDVERMLVRTTQAPGERVTRLAILAGLGCRDDMQKEALSGPEGLEQAYYRALYLEALPLEPKVPGNKLYFALLKERAYPRPDRHGAPQKMRVQAAPSQPPEAARIRSAPATTK